MTVSADVGEVDRLVDSLAAAAVDLVDLEADPVADLLVSAALPRTPRKSGRLAGTVRASVVDDLVVLTAGGSGADYAAPVHAANPWLAATIQDNTNRVVDQVTDQVAGVVATIE